MAGKVSIGLPVVFLRGMIKGFDNFTVVLESDGKQMMIYKHAISTITPARAIAFGADTQENG